MGRLSFVGALHISCVKIDTPGALGKGGNDFMLAAYYIRNGGARRNVAQESPLLERRVT